MKENDYEKATRTCNSCLMALSLAACGSTATASSAAESTSTAASSEAASTDSTAADDGDVLQQLQPLPLLPAPELILPCAVMIF